ncbi:MAG: extensin, partial [Comamonadaceae bacterium]
MFWKWFFAALLALLAGAAYSLYTGLWQLPDRLNPWAVLRIDEEPHWLTGHKLARLSNEPAQCLAVLETAAMDWQVVPDRSTGEDCG